MKRKKYLAVLLASVMLLSLAACGTDDTLATGDTQPIESTEYWAPGVIGLQEEIDISTFDKAMALWDTYADEAQLQHDGSLVLEFVFPSKNITRMWRYDADNRFDVTLEKTSGDYDNVFYWLDGTTMGRLSKETNPDGTYVELDEMLNNPEGNHMVRKTYAADGTILCKVEMSNNSWSVNYYNQTPENLTSEEQVKTILKDAYGEEDISQQEYYTLSYDSGSEEDVNKPYSYAHRTEEGLLIMNVTDPDNYSQYTWVDGEMTDCSEQRTVNGYYYRFVSKEVEYTIEGNKGVANYSSGKQTTFKVLPGEEDTVKAFPLTECTEDLKVVYHYVDDKSPFCNQVNVTDYKTGDTLVFTMDPVPSQLFQDNLLYVDWTQNGVNTRYDWDNNPLGTKVYDIPWYPDYHLMVSGVNPPLRALG